MPEQLLPSHGRIQCRNCWQQHKGQDEFVSDDTRFKLVNDPAAWGAENPRILVLGITKGNTQSGAMKSDEFDKVPYKNFRERLTTVLHLVGLAVDVRDVSRLIAKAETTFAWGSVVRCSLTGWDREKKKYSGESGKVLPAFSDREMGAVVAKCFSTHLARLPSRLELIVLLGNSDSYIKKMMKLVARFYPRDFHFDPQDKVSYEAGGKLWVHVGHPSGGNGYYNNFLNDPPETGQGAKRELARRAIERLIFRAGEPQ